MVKDNLTGLIWHDAAWPSPMNWSDAIETCVNISSEPGPRLPNLRELLSLLHYGYFDPAICNTQGDGKWSYADPFYLFATDTYYWTATTSATGSNFAWAVNIYHGVTSALSKTESHYVMCVDDRYDPF